jgi:hypothetical protein
MTSDSKEEEVPWRGNFPAFLGNEALYPRITGTFPLPAGDFLHSYSRKFAMFLGQYIPQGVGFHFREFLL